MNIEHLFAPFNPQETNLVERLRYWMAAMPDELAFRYLTYGGTLTEQLTYKQLDQRARSIAAHLAAMGLKGQRALLMYPSGLEFVAAFFGCHYAGVTPVPAYPPRRNRNMGRINAISEDAQAAIVLTIDEVIQRSHGMLDQAPSLRRIPWLATEGVPLEIAGDWVKPTINGNELALIQYTSGSTGSPKGVMLTHDNVMANCRMISWCFQTSRNSEVCSWLPLYHDMGLVGGILVPLYGGMTNTLMDPVAFLSRPIRWLRTISHYKGSVSGGPNFAYLLCVEKIDINDCIAEGIDLSSWQLAFNGAEPVRADVLRRFSEKFAPLGFRHEAHYPCYGMAEATLLITGGEKSQAAPIRRFHMNDLAEHRVTHVDADDEQGQDLVGCGRVLPNEHVLIVHPETLQPLETDKIGEVWVDSPSVGIGYWNRPKVTEETFLARTSDPDDQRTYLRTGDLGFRDRDGELFITGRLKDMIIVRGVNRYPQDIEATVENCDERLLAGGTAAFSVEHWDREHLVVVSEVERGRNVSTEGLIEKIRSAITAEHELPPDGVALIRARSVPKTSSGKIQRHECRKQYVARELPIVEEWSNTERGATKATAESNGKPVAAERNGKIDESNVDGKIAEIVFQEVRKVAREAKELNLDTNLVVDLSLDSLHRLEIARNLENVFGGRFPDEVLQEIETVREVTDAISKHMGADVIASAALRAGEEKATEKIAGPIPEAYYKLEKTPEYIRLQHTRDEFKQTGLRDPYFSVHEGRIGDTTRIDGRELISFASYNYLGLSGHPEVNEMAKQAIDEFGTSVSASRLVSGEKTIHKALEKELSEFVGVEDVITFPGGHATNESVVGHLVTQGDLIIHDSLAHNSLVQGAELSGARRRAFEHNNWRQLDVILDEIRRDYRRVLIVIEGLYSMDGDYPDLPRFVDVKNKHKAWLYVDEAHSIGTLGATGRGIGEMFGVDRNDVECWMGTLSKSFGSCGGFVGGKRDLIEYLRYTTPGYVFAAGLPPANVGAALGSLRMLKKEPERVTRLQENSRLFLNLAQEAGLDTGMSLNSPIIPIITGNSAFALQLSEVLFKNGINAQPILKPAVNEQEARVRIFMTAEHSAEQIEKTVEVLSREWSAIRDGKVAVETTH